MKIQTRPLYSLFFLISMICFLGCMDHSTPPIKGWTKVYANDADGKALFGNKVDLIDAVRNGLPIRLGWGSSRVEHVADASFLTISLGEEVFAQISPILGQMPSFTPDSLTLDFRPTNKWTKIAGTNGYNAALMIDYMKDEIVNHRQRKNPTTWYVNYNGTIELGKGNPLWHPTSKLWENWEQ